MRSQKNNFFFSRSGFLIASGIFLIGCGKDEIKTYSIPKEKTPSTSFSKNETSDSVSKPVSTNAKKIPSAVQDETISIEPTWEIPANWKVRPPADMILKSFSIEDKAIVSISVLAGEGGGALMNLNRWRGQLKLEPSEESDLPKLTSTIDVLGGKAMLVDMNGMSSKTGQPARLIAATVRRGNKSWFYKLMGDEKTVAQEKDAFLKFVQSVRYPND
ncbi:MAG: hypothetical protein ACR2H1_08055 [Limisphaerales bacterium]